MTARVSEPKDIFCPFRLLPDLITYPTWFIHSMLSWPTDSFNDFSSIMRNEVINQCHINHQSVPAPWTELEEQWSVFYVQSCAQPRSFVSHETDTDKTTPDTCLWALKQFQIIRVPSRASCPPALSDGPDLHSVLVEIQLFLWLCLSL